MRNSKQRYALRDTIRFSEKTLVFYLSPALNLLHLCINAFFHKHTMRCNKLTN